MLTLSDLIIRPQESLRTALQRMTQNHKGVLFVCNEDEHLIGVISDGDTRRALLDDTLLVAPVGKAMNTDPITAATVEEASNLLHRLTLVAVPVVGQDGRIREVVVEDEGKAKILERAESVEYVVDGVEEPRAVAIIPARGGSKRIPRKNLSVVAGKSLLAWAILAAKAARHVAHVVVSTEDREIAEAARALGIEVPWLRPDYLAKDDTPTLDVILHALDWSVRTLPRVPEVGVLLEPTAPLRLPDQIDEAIELLAATDADSVVSVCELPHVFNPEELLVIDDGHLRPYLPSRTMNSRRLRGEQSPAYVPNGLVYAFRINSVLEQRNLYGEKVLPLITSWEEYLDIDTPEDLELANFRMNRLRGSH